MKRNEAQQGASDCHLLATASSERVPAKEREGTRLTGEETEEGEGAKAGEGWVPKPHSPPPSVLPTPAGPCHMPAVEPQR